MSGGGVTSFASRRHSRKSQPPVSPPAQERPQQHERQREDGLAEGEEGVVAKQRQSMNGAVGHDDERFAGVQQHGAEWRGVERAKEKAAVFEAAMRVGQELQLGKPLLP